MSDFLSFIVVELIRFFTEPLNYDLFTKLQMALVITGTCYIMPTILLILKYSPVFSSSCTCNIAFQAALFTYSIINVLLLLPCLISVCCDIQNTLNSGLEYIHFGSHHISPDSRFSIIL